MARYLVGSLVVLGLAACGRSWLAERDAWRHEAEVACLKSGAVKESASVVRIEPIAGPGICGADFPLKVSALGESAAIGFADELRPPGSVPARNPLAEAPRPAYSPAPYSRPVAQPYPAPYAAPAYPQPANGPMTIRPPGIEDVDVDEEGAYPEGAPAEAPPAYPQRATPAPSYPPRTAVPPAAEPVPLGRERPVAAGPAVTVKPAATLACPVVSALDAWIATGVQPAAMRWFGQPVAEIRQYSAYSCRPVNNQRGNQLSEHSFGNALDIAVFTLADGRKITVKDGWRGAPEEQGFLRDAHLAACKHFATVLGPGADVFHYDHFHVDMRKRSSGVTICRPAAVPGDAVAGRIAPRHEVTGSIKPARARMPVATPMWRGRDEIYTGLPRAVPGED